MSRQLEGVTIGLVKDLEDPGLYVCLKVIFYNSLCILFFVTFFQNKLIKFPLDAETKWIIFPFFLRVYLCHT